MTVSKAFEAGRERARGQASRCPWCDMRFGGMYARLGEHANALVRIREWFFCQNCGPIRLVRTSEALVRYARVDGGRV